MYSATYLLPQSFDTVRYRDGVVLFYNRYLTVVNKSEFFFTFYVQKIIKNKNKEDIRLNRQLCHHLGHCGKSRRGCG